MTDTGVFEINGRKVGPGQRPYMVAEMSGNHNQSLDRALTIVDAAAEAGADAVKLQTYTAETMTLDLDRDEFFINESNELWKGTSLYKLYEQAYTPWEWHQPIMDRCNKHGIACFSAPFDATAVDFLEGLNMPCYKIASFENVDIPLIKKVAATGKPLIISTGMASIAELDEAVTAAREAGCKDLVLLKCTSTYPATPENSNLATIPYLRDLFGVQVGLSDHTLGIGAAIASIPLGAVLVEKHFTLDRADGGVDSAFSIEPAELKTLVEEMERAHQAMGKIHFGMTEKEKASSVFRRSIYISRDVKAGDTLDETNLRIIRPGLGMKPKYWEKVLGKKAAKNARKGTPLDWDLIG